MDLVSEYEIADTNHDQRNPVLLKTSSPVTNLLIESGPLGTYVNDTPEDAIYSMDNNTRVVESHEKFTTALANEASAHDQVVQDTPDQE